MTGSPTRVMGLEVGRTVPDKKRDGGEWESGGDVLLPNGGRDAR